MTINEYTTAALRFAKDSAEWHEIDERCWYTTGSMSTTDDWWEESSDNANGGLDLKWAFHESDEAIRKEAPQRFINEIADLLEQGIEEGWDAEQFGELLKLLR